MPDPVSAKWRRLARLDARLKKLDAEWKRLLDERARIAAEREPAPHGVLRAKRCTWTEAEARALEVRRLSAEGLRQEQIAERLGIKRHMVVYYLSENSKAAHRAAFTRPAVALNPVFSAR